MSNVFRSSLVVCLAAFAQPQLVHAVPFTIDQDTSWIDSETQRGVAPLRGYVEAEWTETALGGFFDFTGGSAIEAGEASHRQLIGPTNLGENPNLEIRVDGALDIDLQGLAFDVQGNARNGDAASNLLWTTIGELPLLEGTLNVEVSSPLGSVSTSFNYSARLLREDTPFRPSAGTLQLEETFVVLLFDVAFGLSVDRISGGTGLGQLGDIVVPLVSDFLARQQFRYYGEVVALAPSEPPPVAVPEPPTLALLIAGLVLAASTRRRG